jgi:hypothetical protein
MQSLTKVMTITRLPIPLLLIGIAVVIFGYCLSGRWRRRFLERGKGSRKARHGLILIHAVSYVHRQETTDVLF